MATDGALRTGNRLRKASRFATAALTFTRSKREQRALEPQIEGLQPLVAFASAVLSVPAVRRAERWRFTSHVCSSLALDEWKTKRTMQLHQGFVWERRRGEQAMIGAERGLGITLSPGNATPRFQAALRCRTPTHTPGLHDVHALLRQRHEASQFRRTAAEALRV